MTKTRDEIIERALLMLGVLGTGQPVAAEDAAKVDIDAVAEQLASERVIDLTSDVQQGTLDKAVFLPFCGVVASMHTAAFSLPSDALAALEIDARDKLAKIERRTRPLVNLTMPRIVGR